jgi:hypothetical protein
MSVFTAIVEYWHEGDQNYRMETFKRPTRLSAMHVARKALKTAFDRPGYMPECARVEDSDERVVAAYEVEVGRIVPKPFGNCDA